MEKTCDAVVVSHTHWDREWYKTFEQFRYALVGAIDELIEAMERDEDYTFFLLDGQTIVIEDYLEIRPERRERFERLVRAGRISVGPWYLQPDEQLVSGESLVRNLLIGHRMAAEYGEVMKEGYLPDTFGHIAQLPQILAGFDIPSFYSMRGTAEDLAETGSEVYWEAPDGSRVWSHHLLSYSNAAVLAPTPETMSLHHGTNISYDSLAELKEQLLAWASSPTLLLMNGNDHLRPQPGVAALVRSLDRHSRDHIFLGSLADFRGLCLSKKADLPTITGERTSGRYQKILQGVLSTRLYLKQRNAAIENLLARVAEPVWTAAAEVGAAYPRRLLLTAWKQLLRNHPHDSICGCSIDRVHRDMLYRFDQAEDVARELVRDGLEELASRVSSSHDEGRDEIALLVFNPSQHQRAGVVELAIDPYIGYPYGKREFAPSGFRPVDLAAYETEEGFPLRIVGEEMISEDMLNRRKSVVKKWVQVRVDSVPPLGYRTVVLRPASSRSAASGAAGTQTPLRAAGSAIENEYLRVSCERDGSLTLLEKESGTSYRGLHVFEDDADRGDEYTFCGTAEAPIRSTDGACRVELIADTPSSVALRLRIAMRVPAGLSADRTSRSAERVELPIESIVRLEPGKRYLEVSTTVVNRAKDHRLRVVFPAGFAAPAALAESAFCVVERPTAAPDGAGWTEQPCATHAQGRYVAVAAPGGAAGLAILNRGLPEYEAAPSGELKLTLLRAVGWLSRPDLSTRPGNAGPEVETPEAQCEGEHRYAYAIRPFAAPFEEAEIWKDADELTVPLVAARIRSTASSIPAARGLFRVHGRGLVITAMKRAEEDDAVILRLYNTLGTDTEGAIESDAALAKAWSTNLNEEERGEMEIHDGRTVRFTCPGHRIMTFKLSPA